MSNRTDLLVPTDVLSAQVAELPGAVVYCVVPPVVVTARNLVQKNFRICGNTHDKHWWGHNCRRRKAVERHPKYATFRWQCSQRQTRCPVGNLNRNMSTVRNLQNSLGSKFDQNMLVPSSHVNLDPTAARLNPIQKMPSGAPVWVRTFAEN